MTNVEKLEELGMLGNVRQRLGAKDEDDTSQDEIINEMTNQELVERDSAWELGSEQWAADIIHNYNELNKMK